MEPMTWLMIANAALWIGLGAYMAFMLRAQKNLEQRLSLLENIHE